MSTDQSIFNAIKSFLEINGVAYRTVHHEPTRTSEESAKARGEDIAVGGKALLMKVDDTFKLFVISAAKKADSSKIKARFGAKKLRFANAEELLQLTGLVPGSVPPFGKPILPFELFVDTSIQQNSKIAFNAGVLTESIIMQTSDYFRIANAEVFEFAG
jgi:Ala-tRNA(Pro) deacylase